MNIFELGIDRIQQAMFVFTRCSGIFIFTPLLGSALIPVPVRVLLSVTVAYLLTLSNPAFPIEVALTPGHLMVGMAGELFVGMVIGFAAHTVFAGFQYSGRLIGFQVGLALVNTIDPQTSNRSTTFSIFQNQLGVMLFLGFNAHHWFIEAVATSLRLIPPYGLRLEPELTEKIVELAGQIFVIGFQIAAPLLAVLIMTDVVLGVIGRSAPQVHILIIGLPIKVLIAMSTMGLTFYFLPSAARRLGGGLFRDLQVLIDLLAG